MKKTILITGSTDGIGLETAKILYSMGHRVLLHGRSEEKLATARSALQGIKSEGEVQAYKADLSSLSKVERLASDILNGHEHLDVLINNAGVFIAKGGVTQDGLELRFAVNSVAPYLLTQKLLPSLGSNGRVVNVSSAAQASVDTGALKGGMSLSDNAAYAQSKLLLTMWSRKMGLDLAETGPVVVSVNPKSFLGSKMVKEAYGVDGGDIRDGADILIRAALSDEFAMAHGLYFDNDAGCFSNPHSDALNDELVNGLVATIDNYLLNR